MNHTEERLRAALTEFDDRIPDLGELTAGIQSGVRRQRRKKQYTMLGATMATVVAVAFAVPYSLGIARDHDGSGHVQTGAPAKPHPTIKLTKEIDYAPDWLPAGYVEAERVVNEQGATATARVYHGSARVKIAEWPTADNTNGRTSTPTVQGKKALGFPIQGGYEIQWQWRQGRWMRVQATGSAKAQSIALRVAQSVRTAKPVAIEALPVSCDLKLCKGNPIVSVYGTSTSWQAIIDQGPAEMIYRDAYPTATTPDLAWNTTVNGHQAMQQDGKLTVDLGNSQTLVIGGPNDTGLPKAQLQQIANNVLPATEVNYPWLGKR
jgi:hypothetical protein